MTDKTSGLLRAYGARPRRTPESAKPEEEEEAAAAEEEEEEEKGAVRGFPDSKEREIATTQQVLKQ